jgi:hypothetical protein
VSTTAKPITSVYDFHTNLYTNRETASLNEISWFLTLCFDKKIDINKKIELVSKLPSFLSTLKSTDRQKPLCTMFRLLDADKKLGLSIKKNGIFKKIEASLDDDEPSEALLELGLRSRGLLTSKLDLGILGFNLEFIPDAERWDWVVKKVPECLNTTVGMQAMLNDSVCRPQMIGHLYKSFNLYSTPDSQLELYEKVSTVYSKLCECSDGKKLAIKIVHWFLREKEFIDVQDDRLSSRYIDLLIKHIALVKTCFGNKEKKLLKETIYKTIEYLSQIEAYDQLTSSFMALATKDIKLFKKIIISKYKIKSKEVLVEMLNKVAFEAGLKNQNSIISILCEAARHHFYFDKIFVDVFIVMANTRLERLAESLKKHD